MRFIIEGYFFFLNILYAVLKLFPVQRKKIFFLSRQTDKPSIDYRMLMKEIEKKYPAYHLVVITKRVEKNLKDVVTKNFFSIFKQMYHLATSSVCIVDGYNIAVSALKHKKSLTVIQLWHSLGAIKKFGQQTLTTEKQRKFAKAMRMHKNYSYIISGAPAMIPYFAKAFGYPEDRFFSYGLPRIDYLLKSTEENKKRIYGAYPQLKEKKVVLYAPTFRDNDDHEYKINELIHAFDSEKYTVVLKLHPSISRGLKISDAAFLCAEFSSMQLTAVADYVITDYSAVSIEAAIANKPVFLYVYDYDEYSISPGLNTDLHAEFPEYTFCDALALYKKLEAQNYNMDTVKKYREKYVADTNGTVTENLAAFIIKECDSNAD